MRKCHTPDASRHTSSSGGDRSNTHWTWWPLLLAKVADRDAKASPWSAGRCIESEVRRLPLVVREKKAKIKHLDRPWPDADSADDSLANRAGSEQSSYTNARAGF